MWCAMNNIEYCHAILDSTDLQKEIEHYETLIEDCGLQVEGLLIKSASAESGRERRHFDVTAQNYKSCAKNYKDLKIKLEADLKEIQIGMAEYEDANLQAAS